MAFFYMVTASLAVSVAILIILVVFCIDQSPQDKTKTNNSDGNNAAKTGANCNGIPNCSKVDPKKNKLKAESN